MLYDERQARDFIMSVYASVCTFLLIFIKLGANQKLLHHWSFQISNSNNTSMAVMRTLELREHVMYHPEILCVIKSSKNTEYFNKFL
jgi:hypothetical protein